MELFNEKFFFAKVTRKCLCRSLFLIKLQVSILQLHWAKGLQERCFLMNFVRHSKHLFYRTPSGDCFCSAKKYFTDKIVKTLWKKKKNVNNLSEKQRHTQNQNLITIYIKSSYPFTIQKCLYFSFLCFSWYIENHEFLEIMQSHWGFIYYRKLCLTFGLKKIVFIYTNVTATFRD